MTIEATPVTPSQREAIGQALLSRVLPPDLTEAEAVRLLEKIEEVVTAAAPVVTKIIRPPAEPAHAEPSTPPAPAALPDVIELTLGGLNFEAPRIIADGEVVTGPIMLARAKEVNAASGKAECEDFLTHQDEINQKIPVEHREEVVFVFTEWRLPDDSLGVAVVCWDDDCWVQGWRWLDDDWYG